MLLEEGACDYSAAIGYAQKQLRHDSLREVTYQRLMRLHALSGDRASAVWVFHTCTTVLRAMAFYRDRLGLSVIANRRAFGLPMVLLAAGDYHNHTALNTL